MKTLFKNAKLVLPDGVQDGSVVVQDGKTASFSPKVKEAFDKTIDLQGNYLTAGFIDIHVHGGGGADFMDGDKEAFERAVLTHLHHGTTTIFPTTLSSTFPELEKTFEVYRTVTQSKSVKATLGGLHLEGPFLNPAACGAQRNDLIVAPKKEHVAFLSENSDIIARITCAPEIEGVYELATALITQGVSFSMGHTCATYEQAEEAAKLGFSAVTHLYSATSGFHKVNQKVHIGVTQAGYGVDELYVELIGDGCHVPKELLRLVARFKGTDKICLVTDAMRAAGTDVKESYLGKICPENRVIIEDGVAKLPDRSSYAGSVGTMDRAFRFAVKEAGLPMHEAAKLVSLNPARLMKIDDKKGSIEVGKDADFVALDENLNVTGVYVGGDAAI